MRRVNELPRRWRCLDQHSQPADLHLALGTLDRASGNRRPADAMKTVAASDEIAVQLLGPAIARERNSRLARIDVAQPHSLCFENNLSSRCLGSVNQIAKH